MGTMIRLDLTPEKTKLVEDSLVASIRAAEKSQDAGPESSRRAVKRHIQELAEVLQDVRASLR